MRSRMLAFVVVALVGDARLAVAKPNPNLPCVRVGGCCVPPPANMVAWWPFDETGGLGSYDIKGANNGTKVNGPVPVPGRVAGALSFDGVNDYVNAPRVIASHDYQNLTVDAWIYLTAYKVDNAIVDYGNGKYVLLVENNELVLVHQAQFLSFAPKSSGANIPLGAWTHVAAVADASSANSFRFYVNGNLVATTNFTPGAYAPVGYYTSGSWIIGAQSGPTDFFTGRIDELEIFQRALTATEIKSIYLAGANGKCKPACLQLNQAKVHYVSRDRAYCDAASFICQKGQEAFNDACGCGCYGNGCPNASCNNVCNTDLSSDASNCGTCGAACSGNHVSRPACDTGECAGACDAGWGDCNGDKLTDGCETALDTLSDCGACYTPCARDNATATCKGGSCRVASCQPGFADCDGNDANGCETRADPATGGCPVCSPDGTCRPSP